MRGETLRERRMGESGEKMRETEKKGDEKEVRVKEGVREGKGEKVDG